MRNLNTPMHGYFRDATHRAGNVIKRAVGTMLAGTLIAAIGLQAAPVKAFADTQTKQEVDVKATHTTVVDYPGGFSASTPSTLQKRGVKIVVRYVGYQSGKYAWKNLTKGEADALRKNGIDIVSVYETTASWMSGGYQAGVQAAKTAKADIIANGGPADPFVYFACDEDADYIGRVNDALRGAASVLGADKVGIYGGYRVVDSALKTHAAAKGWQTMAWSQGKVVKDVALFQVIKPYAGDLGLDYDSNFPHKDDIGQWGRHAVTTGSENASASATAGAAPEAAKAATRTVPTPAGQAAPQTAPAAAPQAASKPAAPVASTPSARVASTPERRGTSARARRVAKDPAPRIASEPVLAKPVFVQLMDLLFSGVSS